MPDRITDIPGAAADPIGAAAESIPSITLEEMDSVKLLNRVDTKYMCSVDVLLSVLSDAREAGYRALDVDGTKLSPYNSVYFDTPALKMFTDHHNRRLVRQKVRTREYVSSGDTYLEIKRKNNHGRTKKKRTSIPLSELNDFSGDADAVQYLAAHSAFTADMISPVLSTEFNRITLVNPAKTERLTIDSNLRFTNFRTGERASLDTAVIIELKQDGHAQSQMKQILLEHRVKPMRVSKYCIAVTLTDPAAKSGRFKTKVRRIEKIINHKIEVI